MWVLLLATCKGEAAAADSLWLPNSHMRVSCTFCNNRWLSKPTCACIPNTEHTDTTRYAQREHPSVGALQLLVPAVLTSSSEPSRPMSAVSTMPSSGSAAKAKAAGRASARISLSCTDDHDQLLLLVLCILSAAAGTSAAGTASEASLACTPADTCVGGGLLLLHVLLLCNLLPAKSLHLPPEPARQIQTIVLELPATANMPAEQPGWAATTH